MSLVKQTVEYKGKTRQILVGGAKLVAPLGTKDLSYVNDEGTTKNYRLCTVGVTTPNGKYTEIVASVPARNIELMEESGATFTLGKTYLCSLERVTNENGSRTLARLSHLSAAEVNAEAMSEIDAMFDDEAAPAVPQQARFAEATSEE